LLFSCGTPSSSEKQENMALIDKLKVGDKAPEFSLPDQHGRRINLADFAGKTNLVVYFYPKDESYGCTKEACSFRDSYQDFKDAGAEVIGISADDIASHQAFAANHKLPFILLSDKGRAVAEKYGVGKSMGVLPGRITFVIDRQGIIRLVFSSQLSFTKHVDEAIALLKTLK
jgi:peroxiredoxin Q/BCP